ncbi:hypothetical protein [Flavobacterium sp.]|uniref:hypothetical protein n=1 Tax=Flavobacterium sp. TaxID=239 RepID=UPI0008CB769D|nr:hypothetical protein [Flavobacterium sp.]OGS61465.1 MAG: hypothetical protein A2X07_07085 [Flavobacteria bacterium GWF1_32_7]HBD26969.1 hypothetical protein [Flavobacterium sp.]
MKKEIHLNYKKSSNLAFISAGLGILNLGLTPNIFSSGLTIFTAIFTLAFVFGLAFLIRLGLPWVKYLLLVLFLIGLIGISFMIKNFEKNPIVGLINIAQTILQICSIILLFKIPKTDSADINGK